jgi:hypothetical protein
MTQLFANNAYSSLAANASNATTTLTLATGTGARFPLPTGGNYFLLTLVGLDSNANESSWEIVKVTARSTDTLTVVRAQESTTAVAWNTGTRVESRATAGTLSTFLTNVVTALGYTPENAANKGAANGYAPLGSDSKIAAAYLPSYVDDVLEYANFAALPSIGESGKIYVLATPYTSGGVTSSQFRWSGSAYAAIISSPGTTDAVTEGSTNLYFTNTRARSAISVTQNLSYNAGTGVITGPDLSGYLLSATASSTYLPLAGGTLTGPVTFAAAQTFPEQVAPSIRPSLLLDFANSGVLDPRITFTRASTATYTGYDGLIKTAASGQARFDYNPTTGESLGLLIEEQRTNLLTYSENFDNAVLIRGNSTIIANAAIAPDGTMTADKHVEDTSNGAHYLVYPFNAVSGNAYTASFYMKGGEKAEALIGFDITTGFSGYQYAKYNLATKAVAAYLGSPTISMIFVGNGWYRCFVTATATGTGNAQLSVQLFNGTTNVYTGDGVSGTYIWGAQLEQGAFPTSYIPSADSFTSRASTGTFIGSNGFIQSAATNVARYNYNPLNLALSPKLLLEPAATNLLTYSEQFDNAVWLKTNSTVTANATAAPDGSMTADMIADTSTSVTSYIDYVMPVANDAAIYTFSIYVKQGNNTTSQAGFYLIGGTAQKSSGFWCSYDWSSGIVTALQADIPISVSATKVQNGWIRLSVTGANNATGNNTIIVRISDSVYMTNSTTNSQYIWGAQLEVGTTPTSYIPTTSAQVTRAADVSSSAQATRAADNAVMTGTNFSSWYRQDEGTVLCTSDSHATATTNASIFSFYDNPSSGNLVDAWHQTDNNLVTRVRTNNQDTIVKVPAVLSNNVKHIMSIGYKSTDSYFINNGTNGLASATAFSFSNAIANLSLGMNQIGTWQMNGHIAKLAYYPKRLSNAELQSITTG